MRIPRVEFVAIATFVTYLMNLGLMSIEKLAMYTMYAKFAKTFGGYFINFKTMPATRKKELVLEFGLHSTNYV
jgi:hypothetical protein